MKRGLVSAGMPSFGGPPEIPRGTNTAVPNRRGMDRNLPDRQADDDQQQRNCHNARDLATWWTLRQIGRGRFGLQAVHGLDSDESKNFGRE